MERCDRCGRELPGNQLILDQRGDKWYGLCDKCFSFIGLCHTCTELHICPFETSSVNIEKIVMQEIRQGNAILRQQVQNPERVRETCAKECKCYSKEFGCLKQINQTCGNYAEEVYNEKV